MATRLSLLPYQTESVFHSGTLILSYMRKTGEGCNCRSYPRFFLICMTASSLTNSRRQRLFIKSTVDGPRSSPPPESSKNTNTRLIKTLQSLQTKLSCRLKELRSGFSVKVLFFLVGFYCATAFATVIGQTGDWDILSAGLAVVVVEGIGALMYKASSKLFDRIRGLITMFNYWKAGLSLGLFLDSFKYEIDMLFDKCRNPFKFDIDILSKFW